MLSPEYLWSVSDSVVNSYDELNKWAVKDMAERIMAAELFNYDELPGTARYRAWMLNQAGMHYDEMSKKVAEITKKSEADIMKLFIEAGLTAIANDFEPFDKEPYDIRTDKKATQLLQSAYEKTNGELHNYTRTTMDYNQKLMIDTLDKAYFDVSTGAKSYSEAIRESIDNVSRKSCTVEYPDSGHVDSIETAVRRAVMTGVNQGTAKISLLNCEKLGTDYVIVSAHEGARYSEKNKVANHLGWQGGVYKIHGTGTYSNEKKDVVNAIKKFLNKIGFKLQGDVIPNLEEETGFPSNPLGLCGYNCRHSFYPFLPEVDDPKKYKHIVTDVEESKKAYDLSQKQRTKEREIRKLKSDLIAYQTSIDNCKDEYTKFELQLDYDKTAARLQKKNKAYREFCQENDLQVESERIKVAKWKKEQAYQATRGAKRYNDSVEKLNNEDEQYDWSDAIPIKHSKEELNSIREYGESKNIIVADISRFDGDINLLKKEIDTIQQMREEYPYLSDKKIAIRTAELNDDDFAITANSTTITFNNKALRNRDITERNIKVAGIFASEKVEDIARHEIGHIIASIKGNKGIEISKQAYYNIYKKMLNNDEIMDYLESNISTYVNKYYGNLVKDVANGRVSVRKYKEIISEIIVKNANNPTEFTQEFIRLLKE